MHAKTQSSLIHLQARAPIPKNGQKNYALLKYVFSTLARQRNHAMPLKGIFIHGH
jgi:hypothetical protein